MKSLPRFIKPYLFSLIVIGLAVLAAAVGAPPAALLQQATDTPTATPLPTPEFEPGNTDGILLFAGLILLIILLPVLWKRKEWDKS